MTCFYTFLRLWKIVWTQKEFSVSFRQCLPAAAVEIHFISIPLDRISNWALPMNHSIVSDILCYVTHYYWVFSCLHSHSRFRWMGEKREERWARWGIIINTSSNNLGRRFLLEELSEHSLLKTLRHLGFFILCKKLQRNYQKPELRRATNLYKNI